MDELEAITTPVEEKYKRDMSPIKFFNIENPPEEYLEAKQIVQNRMQNIQH